MTNLAPTDAPPSPGLSQIERVVDTFVAPRKTFTDILRSSSWRLPFVLMCVIGLGYTRAIDTKVGFATISQQQISKNKFAADKIDALPAEQRQAIYDKSAARTKTITYCFPLLILFFGLLTAFLWWIGLNFGLGAETRFPQIFAVWMYASLPKILLSILAAVLLYAGVGVDNFDMQNPVGTNPGYYLSESMPALRAMGGFIDLFALWSLYLGVLGTAIISGKKISQTAIVVVGWWLLGMILTTGMAAIFS